MNIALIGYGKMGHAVEKVATSRGHHIVACVDVDTQWDDNIAKSDVAIEFTTPKTAVDNIQRLWEIGLKVVCGTTGWYDKLPSMIEQCNNGYRTLFVASNFSIGMNIVFDLNQRLARLMKGRDEYAINICETHHIHKLDAPSGTALQLQRQIVEQGIEREIPIESIREGEVAGIHTITYDGPNDTITLCHSAKNREGLALGAVLAAEYTADKKGFLTMKDMLA